MKNQNNTKLMILSALGVFSLLSVSSSSLEAAPAREAKKAAFVKAEQAETPPAESEKKQADRMNAINRALEQSLTERAKSQSEYERHNDRMQVRQAVSAREVRATESRLDLDSREVRADSKRDLREETRREKRLNWLDD